MAGDYQGADFVFLVLWDSLVGERKAKGVARPGSRPSKASWSVACRPVGPSVLYLAAKKKRTQSHGECAHTRIIFLNEVKQIDYICTMSESSDQKRPGIR
jgi:hypothetical protein